MFGWVINTPLSIAFENFNEKSTQSCTILSTREKRGGLTSLTNISGGLVPKQDIGKFEDFL